MPSEDPSDYKSLSSLEAVAGIQDPQPPPVHDPLASAASIVETQFTVKNADGSIIATTPVPHPSGIDLRVRRDWQPICSGSTPTTYVEDPVTGEVYLWQQHSYDSEDGRSRANEILFPDIRHRKQTDKHHHSARTLAVGASGIGSVVTTWDKFLDLH